MKKISLLAIAALTVFSASAQKDVVKAAERAYKASDEPAAEVIKIITPALSDPETKDQADTWFFPGAASFKNYDHLLGLKQFGKLPENGNTTMGQNLIDGYNYFVKALPLDSLPDEKGKVKPKRSKSIMGTFIGHMGDYVNMGVELYQAGDYGRAYEVWKIFGTLPQYPDVKKGLNKDMLPDSLFAEIAFNEALAAWQNENLEGALAAFTKAKNLGYKKKSLYDNAIAVASQLKNDQALLTFAEEAIPLYGKDDPMYIGQVANYYLTNKQLDKAFDVINKAIELDPENAQYYVIRGVLYENRETSPEMKALAKADYEKAMGLDAKNAQAVFNYGRMIYDEALTLADAAPTRQDEYQTYYTEKLRPLYLQAAEVIENAYNLNPDNTDTLRYLETIYYQLNDEAKLNDVKARK